MIQSAEAEGASSAPSDEGALGARLDRLMRAAEQEAVQIREAAERRAAALLTEIDRHEQDRRREWREREAAVASAERRAVDELAEAREQAERLVEAAEDEAERIRGRARLQAREIGDAAEESIEHLRRDAERELERFTQLRDAAKAEIQRLLRSLDGVRDALAYELDVAAPGVPASTPSHARQAIDGPAVSRPTAAVAAIGRRRGDLHRGRLSGLSAAATEQMDDPGPS